MASTSLAPANAFSGGRLRRTVVSTVEQFVAGTQDRPTGVTLQGISHIGLTVTDMATSIAFWTRVMGFEVTGQDDASSLLLHRAGRVAIGLTAHGGDAHGPFDHLQVGLDHLGFAVESLAALVGWSGRLEHDGIEHGGIVSSDAGHHLNFKAPDGIPIELFVIARGTLEALGLTGPADAHANTHAVPVVEG